MKTVLVLFTALLSVLADDSGPPSFISEAPVHEQVVDDIYSLMEMVNNLKYFDIASIPTFFPLDENFFDIMFLLQKIKVDSSDIKKLRSKTTKDVAKIQDLFYKHSSGLAEFNDLLAETAHDLLSKSKDYLKLEENWRAILRVSTGSVSDLMTIIERVEVRSAKFQYTVEKLIRSSRSHDLETITKIRKRVVEIAGGFSENYEELYMFLAKAHDALNKVMPALRAHIAYLSES